MSYFKKMIKSIISEIKIIYFLYIIFFLTIVLESRSEKFEFKYVNTEMTQEERIEFMEEVSCRTAKTEDEDKPRVQNNLLGCAYIFKDDICYLDKPVCVCKEFDSYDYFFLEKSLNEKSCNKAYKSIEKKRDKIIDRCIDKAGKMKNELAYRQKYNLCLKMNLPGSPFE